VEGARRTAVPDRLLDMHQGVPVTETLRQAILVPATQRIWVVDRVVPAGVLAVTGEGGSVLRALGAFHAHAGHVRPAVAEVAVARVLMEVATLRVCRAVLPDWRWRGRGGGVACRRAARSAVRAPVAVAVLGTAIPPLERVARLWERALAVAPRIGCGSGGGGSVGVRKSHRRSEEHGEHDDLDHSDRRSSDSINWFANFSRRFLSCNTIIKYT